MDAEIPFTSVSLDSFTKLRLLAPFGEGNPSPRFLTTAVRIEACRSIGGGRHQRLVLNKDGASQTALWWWNRNAPDADLLADVIYTLNRNDYNGTTSIQLVIEADVGGAAPGRGATGAWRAAARDRGPEIAPGLRHRRCRRVILCLFGEGARVAVGCANRYSLRVCETLALMTVPAHLSVLREMLAVTGCRRLALAYPAVRRGGAIHQEADVHPQAGGRPRQRHHPRTPGRKHG